MLGLAVGNQLLHVPYIQPSIRPQMVIRPSGAMIPSGMMRQMAVPQFPAGLGGTQPVAAPAAQQIMLIDPQTYLAQQQQQLLQQQQQQQLYAYNQQAMLVSQLMVNLSYKSSPKLT